ncbi:MAG: YceI family protein [Thermoanaerobaculia bacterium]
MLHPEARNRWILLTLLLTPTLTGCADPAADAPQAVVEASAPPVEEASADPGAPFAIGSESTIGFVGSKVTGSHNGGFGSFGGTIWLADGGPENSRLEVEIDTTSLWADNERLTGHLKSADFFDVENYPVAIFESSSIEATATGAYIVTGNLDLHGVTKQIGFPATIEIGDGEIRATAEFAIKRFDFDIVYPGKAEDLIRDDVLVKLDLVATPTGPAV